MRFIGQTRRTRLVLEDDVQGVDDAGNVWSAALVCWEAIWWWPGLERVLTTKDGQEQVDEEVGAAATLKEDSERREHDGADDLDDVAGWGVSLCCYCGGAIEASLAGCGALGVTKQ